MTPTLYWIPGPWRGKLAITARPRGGDWLSDETRGWSLAGIDIIVSLLEKDEERDLSLEDEERAAKGAGLQFFSFPIPDRGVPASVPQTAGLLSTLRRELMAGRNVAVHCRQGIGRSALIAIGTLVTSGASPHDAIEAVGAARGLRVPETAEQRAWVEQVLAAHLAAA